MKKQLTFAAGILLALSTAVAMNGRDETPVVASKAATAQSSADLSLQASVEVVSMWKEHAKSAASTPLARPL